MKYFRIFTFLTLIFSVVIVSSCKTQQSAHAPTLPKLPKITNPTFESHNHGTEKIYHVSFVLDDSEYTPNEVVLFGVRKILRSANIRGNVVNVDVIHQTQKLQDYEIVPTELANGVIFKIGDVTYLKTVNFTNIKQ